MKNIKTKQVITILLILITMIVIPVNNTVSQAKTTIILKEKQKEFDKAFKKAFNQYRKSVGVGKLKSNDGLIKAARVRAKELSISFSHTRPKNKSLINLCDKKGAKPYKRYAEIIAKLKCQKSDITKNTRKLALMTIYDGWRHSPPHNAAMLDGKYTFCGTSYYFVDESLFVCTIFAGY